MIITQPALLLSNFNFPVENVYKSGYSKIINFLFPQEKIDGDRKIEKDGTA